MPAFNGGGACCCWFPPLSDACSRAPPLSCQVGDIYGEDGCANLGLPPTMTAANFGRLASLAKSSCPAPTQASGQASGSASPSAPSEADVAAACLQMIAQASAVLVRTIAQQAKCLTRVFVAGGFMDANPLARKVRRGGERVLS